MLKHNVEIIQEKDLIIIKDLERVFKISEFSDNERKIIFSLKKNKNLNNLKQIYGYDEVINSIKKIGLLQQSEYLEYLDEYKIGNKIQDIRIFLVASNNNKEYFFNVLNKKKINLVDDMDSADIAIVIDFSNDFENLLDLNNQIILKNKKGIFIFQDFKNLIITPLLMKNKFCLKCFFKTRNYILGEKNLSKYYKIKTNNIKYEKSVYEAVFSIFFNEFIKCLNNIHNNINDKVIIFNYFETSIEKILLYPYMDCNICH